MITAVDAAEARLGEGAGGGGGGGGILAGGTGGGWPAAAARRHRRLDRGRTCLDGAAGPGFNCRETAAPGLASTGRDGDAGPGLDWPGTAGPRLARDGEAEPTLPVRASGWHRLFGAQCCAGAPVFSETFVE